MRHETSDGPNGVATPEEIHQLGAQVRQQLSGRLREFRLELRGRALVLRGHARTYYAKQLAQHAVMRATDFPILQNEIEVSQGICPRHPPVSGGPETRRSVDNGCVCEESERFTERSLPCLW